MLTVKSMDVRDNFKHFCDTAFKGETVVVSRCRNENVVLLSEVIYNELMQAAKEKRNAEYMKMLDQSMEEAARGGFVMKSLDELEEYEK